MNKLIPTPCRKCGGETTIKWEKLKNGDYIPANGEFLNKRCLRCGFSELIADLETQNKQEQDD